MFRDLLASSAASLFPALVLAMAALAAWVASLLAKGIRDKRLAAAITLLTYGAAGVVADFAQHVVTDLKDPTKPGKWTSVVGASLRLQAVSLLRDLYPFAVDVITRALRDPAKVDVLLGTLLEKAVVDLKAKTPLPLVAAESLPGLAADPVVLSPGTEMPPALGAPSFADSARAAGTSLPPPSVPRAPAGEP